MKIERTKNTINGFVWGAVGKVVNIALPFLIRTVMIYKLGVEYLGLSSLFASILQVLSLSELGFSYACVYAMYKPVAEDDFSLVGAILVYLKKIYYIIGTGILILGLVLVPFLPLIINGDVPGNVNLYGVYFIYLANSAVSYFFFGYKSALLSALQRNDVINKALLISNTVLRLSQCAILFIIPNYYLFVILIPVSTILGNIMKSYYVDHYYSRYLQCTEMPHSVREDIKNHIVPLLGIKISTVLINAADTLVISAFLGLAETAIYNNYFFVMSSIQTIIYEIHGSMLAGVGNSLVVENTEQVSQKFKILHFVNIWLVSICTVCFICLFQPFMTLWVGEEYLLPFGMVILFGAYFFSTTAMRIVIVYKDAAGVWKEDMIRCYASCIINILLNVVTVRYIGLYGVIGSSVFVSMVIDPWMAKTVHRKILQQSSKSFYLYYVKDILVCVILCAVFAAISKFFPSGWVGLVLRLFICVVGGIVALYVVYRKDSRFAAASEWVISTVKRVLCRKKDKRGV